MKYNWWNIAMGILSMNIATVIIYGRSPTFLDESNVLTRIVQRREE